MTEIGPGADRQPLDIKLRSGSLLRSRLRRRRLRPKHHSFSFSYLEQIMNIYPGAIRCGIRCRVAFSKEVLNVRT